MGIEVDYFAEVCSILKAKFSDDPTKTIRYCFDFISADII